MGGQHAHPSSIDDVDVFSAETFVDWYPTYDLLRTECPVYQVPGTNQFFLTRYDDIMTVMRRTDIFRRGGGSTAPLLKDSDAARYYAEHGWPKILPLGSEPPAHRRWRNLVDPFFSVTGSETRRQLITGFVDELIDAFPDDGPIDFMEAFAVPLPVNVITSIIGFPVDDVPRLKAWSEAWVAPFSGLLSPEEEQQVAIDSVEFQRYIHGHIEDRRVNPTDDVISHLVQAKVELPNETRPLTDGEIINIVDHLYIGGNETTTFALTSGLWLLCRHPSYHDLLRRKAELIPRWVDEVLRLESPTQGLYRHAAVDTELSGVAIPKGSAVHVRYAAANRDPEHFGCPADINLERPTSPRHMAFSLGETHCPGAALSRLEQVIASEALVERLASVELVDTGRPLRHEANFTLRAFPRFDIHVRKASAQRH